MIVQLGLYVHSHSPLKYELFSSRMLKIGWKKHFMLYPHISHVYVHLRDQSFFVCEFLVNTTPQYCKAYYTCWLFFMYKCALWLLYQHWSRTDILEKIMAVRFQRKLSITNTKEIKHAKMETRFAFCMPGTQSQPSVWVNW